MLNETNNVREPLCTAIVALIAEDSSAAEPDVTLEVKDESESHTDAELTLASSEARTLEHADENEYPITVIET
jgi:hypothetical protein